MSLARKYLYFILAGITYLLVHEGVHIIQALIYGIYKGIDLLPLGVEIEVIQPLTISDLKLAVFSGLSSIFTILMGYVLFLLSPVVLKSKKQYFKNYIYYVTFVFLLLDPIYISILSNFVGGDINGIALGLHIPYMIVRSVYLIVAIINVCLIYKKLYPAYVIKK